MASNFYKFFGHDWPYIAERLYEILSQGYTLDKPLFLRAMYPYMFATKKTRMQLAFGLYNVKGDGEIRACDVSSMLRALPPGSIVLEEWMVLVDELVGFRIGTKSDEVLRIP
jgi:hypothetical protein